MPKNYKWLYSYQTYAFDTVDGSIHDGEYCLPEDTIGGFLIYNDKDTESFTRVPTLDTQGMIQIHRTANRAFDVFQDPDTLAIERYASDLQTYKNLAVKDAGPRTKIKL